jgi:hypothetical protein
VEAALGGLVVQDMKVHMLEYDCAMGGVGDVAVDDAEVRAFAVQ